ncbi:MAG: glycosyl transferase family 39 [Synechococcaceae bacterium WB8_1B_136]|nr:glycosyl transferase family 39 [Synechococcaceae bacterium WB8_1B_136]
MHRLNSWLDADERRPLGLALLALMGLCLLAFFNHLGTLGLMDKTEGLFAEVPHQMLRSGDWVTPRWNGDTFFDYPVWGYWMVGLSFRLWGVSAWAARLPAAMAATATVLGLFAVLLLLAPAQEPWRPRIGRATLCATVLALSPGWVGWARSSVTDMFLSSAIALALFGFALAHGAGERLWLRRLGHGALALFAGIAVLAKGPVGLLLPGLVIVVFLLLKGQLLGELRRTPWLPISALFVGVAAPWYALATRANGTKFLARFIGFSNLERFTSVLYAHPGPPWFYLPWVLLLLLPWSLFLPVAIARLQLWPLARWRVPPSPADLPLLAFVWLVLVVGFFSTAATKLPGYILPALPAGALLVGLLFQPLPPPADQPCQPLASEPLGAGVRVSGWINALVLAVMALAAAVAPRFLGADPAYPRFAEAVRSSGLPLLLALPLLAAALSLAALLLLKPTGLSWLWMPNGAAFVAVLALVVPALAPLLDRERQLPIRQLATLAGRQALPREPLLVAGYKRYSVVFYSGRPVLFVDNPRHALEALHGPKAPQPSPPTLLLMGSDSEFLDFGLGPGDGKLIARRDAHQLLRVPIDRLRQLAAGP